MIIAQFYPNGEFTQGVATAHKRKSRLDHLSDRAIATKAPQCRHELNAQMNAELNADITEPGVEFISASGALHTYLCRDDRTYHYAVEPVEGEAYVVESEHPPIRYAQLVGASPLGLSNARILQKTPKPSRKRCLTITKSMARNLRQACYLLEKAYTKDCLSFLTLTVPNLTHEDMTRVSNAWGALVHRFLEWLRYRLALKGVPLEYCYCTEIQLERHEKYGERAYHLHLVFRGRKQRSGWIVSPKKVRKAWVRCLKSVCDGSFVETALENLQRVRKSAARYLSKYISKGCKNNHTSALTDSTDSIKPIHWGGISRSLRRFIERLTFRLTGSSHDGATGSMFTRLIPRLAQCGVIDFFCRGFISLNGGKGEGGERGIHVSVGALSKPLWEGGYQQLMYYMSLLQHQDTVDS